MGTSEFSLNKVDARLDSQEHVTLIVNSLFDISFRFDCKFTIQSDIKKGHQSLFIHPTIVLIGVHASLESLSLEPA